MPSGTRASARTRRPARTTTRTSAPRTRRSSAPTVSPSLAPPGTGDAAVACARVPVVPCGSHDEHVEVRRALHRARQRVVGERGIGLRERDERDPRGVVRVAVLVRIDRLLEPLDDLVGRPVDRPAAGGCGLPAGDPDRQDARTCRDAREPARTAGADEEPGHLGAVLLESRRVVRARRRQGVRIAADDVDPVRDLPAQDTGGSGRRRCRGGRSRRRARRSRGGRCPRGGRSRRAKAELSSIRSRDGRRIGGAYRVDARRPRARARGSRASRGRPRRRLRSGRACSGTSAAARRRGSRAAGGACAGRGAPASSTSAPGCSSPRRPPLRRRSARERARKHDDHLLAERGLARQGLDARRAGEPAPGRRRRREARGLGRGARAGRRRPRRGRPARPTVSGCGLSPPRRIRIEGKIARARRAARRSGRRRRSSRRCRCSTRAARAWRPRARAASSEFAATPPTTAIRSRPLCSRGGRVTRSTSARTIARW